MHCILPHIHCDQWWALQLWRNQYLCCHLSDVCVICCILQHVSNSEQASPTSPVMQPLKKEMWKLVKRKFFTSSDLVYYNCLLRNPCVSAANIYFSCWHSNRPCPKQYHPYGSIIAMVFCIMLAAPYRKYLSGSCRYFLALGISNSF